VLAGEMDREGDAVAEGDGEGEGEADEGARWDVCVESAFEVFEASATELVFFPLPLGAGCACRR
jgi:hypothetical protein